MVIRLSSFFFPSERNKNVEGYVPPCPKLLDLQVCTFFWSPKFQRNRNFKSEGYCIFIQRKNKLSHSIVAKPKRFLDLFMFLLPLLYLH